jgi:hypothetical protein
MSLFEDHERELKAALDGIVSRVISTALPSGAHLIEIDDYPLVPGWNREKTRLLFIAPPGYPSAQPDSFWVEPVGLRLANGDTPKNSNDSNPIPEVGQRGTWFSWHVQDWRPNRDTLTTYLKVIRDRLDPPR